MENRVFTNQAGQFVQAHGRKKRWLKVVTVLAAIVVFCTTYALIMPAVTMQGKTYCGYEEHKEHSDECYEQIKKLTCTRSEEGHKHTAQCYSEERTLTCGIEETAGHQHTDSCYSEEQILVCTDNSPDHVHDENCYATQKTLICGNEEQPEHHHDENCYTTQPVLTCGKEEQEPHQHTEECYTLAADTEHLTCKETIHVHTLQCYSDPEADVEKAAIWEKTFEDVELSGNWSGDVVSIAETQLGYTESKTNYEVQSDGTSRKGYTRYGAWYGIPYGDWCAMFCSFCLNYAEVDPKLMPRDANCPNWIRTLSQKQYDLYHPALNEKAEEEEEKKEAAEAEEKKEEEEPEEEKYIPRPGDLIFFDWDRFDPEHPEYRSADHIGFVFELIYDEKTGELTKIKTIEGNSADCVRHNTYSFTDSRILGYGEIPKNPKNIRTIESQPASDGAVAVISGELPKEAQAEITAVPLSEKELIAYIGAEKAALMTGYAAYDIKIMVDGEEWQPDDTVSVTVRQPELDLSGGNRLGLAHVEDGADNATDVNVQKNENGDIVFDADGFSLYIIYTSFTVDFRYEDCAYSMNGLESMRLAELFTALGIEADIADVQSAVFSDPALLLVEPTEDSDWLLTSLRAFTTDETLTVTFADGTEIVIATTDASTEPENLIINKVWDDDKSEHGPVTVNVIDSEGNTVATVVLSSTNGWHDSVSLPLNENGKMDYTFEEILSEGEAGEYWIDYGKIDYVEGETPVYWVPVDPTAFAAKDFVIYGSGSALSHDGGTLKTASPSLTNESKIIGGKTYSKYFTEDQITDNEIWTASGASNTTLTAKGTNYRLEYSSSTISLKSNGTDTWNISGNKLRQGSSDRYLRLDATSFYTSSSSSATTITLYEKVEDEPIPGHYEVTITNKEIEYRDLLIKKEWDDVTPDREHDPVTVTMWNKAKDTSWTVTLSEDNDWQETVEHLMVAADGKMHYTFEEEFSDADKDDYVSYCGSIVEIPASDGGGYYVKESDITGDNSFVDGKQYMLYSGSRAINRNGTSGVNTANPTKGSTSEPVVFEGKQYTDYFPATGTGAVPDTAGWTYSENKLSNSNYYIRYSSSNSTVGVTNTSSSGWNAAMSEKKLQITSGTSTRYLTVTSSNTVGSTTTKSSGTDITLYRYVQTEDVPAHFEVTITNAEIEYTNLTVNKTWSDGGTDHDPVTVHLYDKRTNKKVKDAVLSSDNGWTYTFERLIKPAENQPFGYYVLEDYVPGYVSMPSEITELVANQTYWVPASTNQFSAGTDYLLYSNGYVIERNGSSAIKATAVTRGMNVGGVSYPTYISGDEVSGIESTAVWSAERYGSYGSSIAIKNGNYYLKYGSGTSGYQLSTSPGTVTMYNNSKLNLYTGSGDDRSNHYLNISTGGALSYTSKNSSASGFTLYVKRTVATGVSGYEMTIENKEVVTDPSTVIDPPDVSKTIDYLGDDVTNPDTDLVGEDNYRLYLDIDNLNLNTHPEGIDLLLILDGTSSMINESILDGDYPITHMDEIINGSYGPGVTRLSDGRTGNQGNAYTYARETDGLVYQFLNMNPNNRVGVIEFANWSVTAIRQSWTTKAQLLNGRADDPKNYYVDVTMAGNGTNYEAGYKKADTLLQQRDGNRPVIMVFMTDGRPNHLFINGVETEHKKDDEEREECNKAAYTYAQGLIANEDNQIESTAVVAIGEASLPASRAMLQEHADAIGGPLLVGDGVDSMRDAMFKAVGLVGYAPLKITDDLSDYVTFADDLDLKITFEKIGSDIKTVWTDDGATDDNVDDGEPIVIGVVISGDRIEVTFNPSLKLLPLKRITVSYNVTTTQEALDVYSTAHKYPHTGDDGTDYPGNETSSEQPGFHSNDQAQVVYRDAFEQYSEDYDHPVVQLPYDPAIPVPPSDIDYPDLGDDKVTIHKQIDWTGGDDDGNPIEGDENLYRLYLDLEAQGKPIDLLLVLDQSSSMCLDVDGNAVSGDGESRQDVLKAFLNGEKSDHSDGFIQQFLCANDGNALAILTFGTDCSEDRLIRDWDDTDDSVALMSNQELRSANQAANYNAAYYVANNIWAARRQESSNDKIMIFLSDGEPTLTYKDGAMHNSLADPENVVGYGSIGKDTNIVADLINSELSDLYLDAVAHSTENRNANRDNSQGLEDDSGNTYTNDVYWRSFSSGYETANGDTVYTAVYPRLVDYSAAEIYLPGLVQFPFGSFAEEAEGADPDAEWQYAEWYRDVWSNYSDAEKYSWLFGGEIDGETVEPHISYMQEHDMFYLTERAYKEFAEANSDVLPYTIGFAGDTEKTYANGRAANEVLKYMVGERNIEESECEHFVHCDSAEDLSAAFERMTYLLNVSMTDTVSKYVTITEAPDLEIRLTDEKYGSQTGYPYLYRNGEFTELGEALLDTELTKIDRAAGKVDVVFKADAKFSEAMKVEASFNIRANITAYETQQASGYNAVGDRDTDYGTNNTSSLKRGFYSNDNAKAKAEYTLGGKYEKYFPKPVVQVCKPSVPDPIVPPENDDGVTIHKKIDWLGEDENGETVKGMDDMYRLYLDLEAQEQPIDLLLVIDQSGSMAEGMDGSANPAAGQSRQDILLSFLNGSKSNGFIHQFLTANSSNDLAILTFSDDSNSGTAVLNGKNRIKDRYIRQWGSNDSHSVTLEAPYGATNYTAAYAAADEIWEAKSDSTNKKVMIFLSDGEPSIAYRDYQMHYSYAEGLTIGNGATPPILEATTLAGLLKNYFGGAYNEALNSDTTSGRKDRLEGSTLTDDYGNLYYRKQFAVETDDFPQEIEMFSQATGKSSLNISLPSWLTEFPYGSITNKEEAKAFYKDYWKETSIDVRNAWIEKNVRTDGVVWDIFYQTEWAFQDFSEENPDVVTYSIGYSSGTKGTYDNGREKSEVLKYMTGEQGKAESECERFFQSDSADKLAAVINGITLLSNVSMTDTLSDYVDFSDAPDLQIILTDENYSNYYGEDEDYAVLYTNGDFTDLGEQLLDTAKTKIDLTGKKVDVVFKPGVTFNKDMKVEAAFTVKLTKKAYDDKEDPGYTAVGDPLTDRDTVHPTSSGQDGFYSNDNPNAKAAWSRGGEHEENFPKPVVQVPEARTVTLKIKKIDAGGDRNALTGAEFDLYSVLPAAAEGCETYTENDTVRYLAKVNTGSLTAGEDRLITLEELPVGQYCLIETKAPVGYIMLEKPVFFEVTSEAITVASESAESALTDENDSLLLLVKNISGCELPETGGSGTLPFTLCGFGLMVTALMYGFSMRRKRERRYER